MLKKNTYIFLSLFICSLLVLSFQNCGQISDSKVPVATGAIVLDDFTITKEDCSQEGLCEVTVVKLQQQVEDEMGLLKPSITDEEIPSEFHRLDEKSGNYKKCVLINRRDDIRYEYICSQI